MLHVESKLAQKSLGMSGIAALLLPGIVAQSAQTEGRVHHVWECKANFMELWLYVCKLGALGHRHVISHIEAAKVGTKAEATSQGIDCEHVSCIHVHGIRSKCLKGRATLNENGILARLAAVRRLPTSAR